MEEAIMIENESEINFSPEEIENFKRKCQIALKAVKEAIQFLNIPENSPKDFQGKNQRFNTYYQNAGDNITLSIELNPFMTVGAVHLSLGHIALELLDDLEILFSDSEAAALFEISDSQKENIIHDRLVSLIVAFILHAPIVLYHSLYQAVGESVINNINKIVEPLFRKDNDELGEGNYLNLLPNNKLNDIVSRFPKSNFRLLNYVEIIDNEFKEYRKNVYRGRKALLTPERFDNLFKEYEEIRITYKIIKKAYYQKKGAYEITYPNATMEDWEMHWEKYLTEEFPFYTFTKTDTERKPSELANQHLAKEYDYHPARIEKKVIESRALAKLREKIKSL